MTPPDLLAADELGELTSALSALRNAQGYALNAAAIFIEVVTAQDAAGRANVARQFRTFRDLYGKAIQDVSAQRVLRAQGAPAKDLLATARETSERFANLNEDTDFADVPAIAAGQLVHFVRLEGVPALMQLAGLLSSIKKRHEKAFYALTRDRIARLDKMFTEVEDIGRMIHLISLNASVEAARAGGESGRSFKVIADEIRGLAQQASSLIDTTRSGVLPGAEADLIGLRRA